ncbi:hypothetical protein [Cryptosporangium sp. NPDC048952]|uniref:hypothetical protein n=1 Tax=Cryptosporangium sp. NPDC048952 TaxID=3363961 RepID=UPI0037236697
MSWTVVVTVAGSMVGTLAGVLVGGFLTRRSQSQHWLKDTKAAAYRTLLREYARIEFDVRRAYLGTLPVTDVDWARWGGALTELSLVADEEVVTAITPVGDALVQMDAYVHAGHKNADEWARLLTTLVDAQVVFVNAARHSLDRAQPHLTLPIGGPLIPERDPASAHDSDPTPRPSQRANPRPS